MGKISVPFDALDHSYPRFFPFRDQASQSVQTTTSHLLAPSSIDFLLDRE